MNRNFKSGFSNDLNTMIDLKVALGSSESTYISRATAFDCYCLENYPEASTLTKLIVLGWLTLDIRTASMETNRKAAFMRAFGKYQNSLGRDAYVITESYTAGRSIFVPYLFTDEELAALFHEIDTYENPQKPYEPLLLSTYFRLTYTCGLRPNEGRNLKRNDVDLAIGEIRIVNSKWHKSRNVVMSDEMLSLMKSYAAVRDAMFAENEYFFPGPEGDPYTANWIGGKFKRFFALSNPDIPKELLPFVRVYDLRHRFATAVLNRWLDQKVDLTSRLPYLQTYMGHKELSATAYYIHLLPENLVKSAGIDWESMNSLLPEVELWEK